MAPLTWLITGGSSGIGLALALVARRQGHSVIATARNPSKASSTTPEFEKLGGKWLQLDVTNSNTEDVVRDIVREQQVDVVVNSAGYSLSGAFEDFRHVSSGESMLTTANTKKSEQEMFDQMNTNFFGVTRVLKGAIPVFRERKSGTIVNVSSGAAFLGRESRSLYAASKSALESVSEALSVELSPFNIRVLIVDLGAFRTNFASTVVTPQSQQNNGGVSEPYRGSAIEKLLKMTSTFSTTAPGDPEEAASRILEAVTKTGLAGQQDHLRLILGSDSLTRARQTVKDFGDNVEAMNEIAASTDFK